MSSEKCSFIQSLALATVALVTISTFTVYAHANVNPNLEKRAIKGQQVARSQALEKIEKIGIPITSELLSSLDANLLQLSQTPEVIQNDSLTADANGQIGGSRSFGCFLVKASLGLMVNVNLGAAVCTNFRETYVLTFFPISGGASAFLGLGLFYMKTSIAPPISDYFKCISIDAGYVVVAGLLGCISSQSEDKRFTLIGLQAALGGNFTGVLVYVE